MRVIVFGGTGWVGHHIVLAFASAGHEVFICSRGKKSTYEAEIPESIPRIQADKSDEADMARVFSGHYDVVVDSVPSDTSIELVVKHARRLKRYLHCSSTGGYAPLPFIPCDETMPYEHFMGGWKEKAVMDARVMDLFHRQGFPATVIRPPYITGPGMLPMDNFGGRRQDFITDILERKPLVLPNDGQVLLQPIHVRDLGHAFLLAASTPPAVGQIYNICLEKAVTITRYLQITAAALDREVEIQYLPVDEMVKRYGDGINERWLRFFATHMCYDIRKAREQIGYGPHCTAEQAIEETAHWAAQKLRA